MCCQWKYIAQWASNHTLSVTIKEMAGTVRGRTIGTHGWPLTKLCNRIMIWNWANATFLVPHSHPRWWKEQIMTLRSIQTVHPINLDYTKTGSFNKARKPFHELLLKPMKCHLMMPHSPPRWWKENYDIKIFKNSTFNPSGVCQEGIFQKRLPTTEIISWDFLGTHEMPPLQ